MSNKSSILFFFMLMFYGVVLFGQTPHFFVHPFSKTNKKEAINTLLESKNGLIWIGTDKGLYYYDGIQFTPVPLPNDASSISISSIFEDEEGIVWVGTKSGTIYQKRQNRPLTKWQPEEGTPTVKITGFCTSSDSLFWMASYGEGLYYLKNNRIYNIDTDDGLSSNEIYAIQNFKDGILAASDFGVHFCTIEGNRKKVQLFNHQHQLGDEIVKTLKLKDENSFFVGTFEKGIFLWNDTTKSFTCLTPDWPYGEIKSIEYFSSNELWIGTAEYGLFRYSLLEKKIFKVDLHFAKNAKIFALLKDQEGNIWVADNKIGLSTANCRFDNFANQLGNIQSVLFYNRNELWIGTPTGLYKMNTSGQKVDFVPVVPEKKLNVISLYEDDFGRIWIGTFNKGLFAFDPIQNKIAHYTEKNRLLNDNILSITGDGQFLWLATLGGVFQLDLSKDVTPEVAMFKNFTKHDGLGTNFIYKVFASSNDRIWFGTDGKGISMAENDTIYNFKKAGNLKLKSVYDITEDHRGHIWFSTGMHGIIEFDGENFHPLNLNHFDSKEQFYSLTVDQNGNIILVNKNEICILNPVSKDILCLDEEIGLLENGPMLNAIAKDKFNRIWIGAENKIFRYLPLEEELSTQPRLNINQVKVFIEPVDFQVINSFDNKENNLIFEYNGIWLTAPHKVAYRYQLEGYDLDWISSKDNQATYSNLSPGNYTFKVEATANNDFENSAIDAYQFTIQKPFYKKNWFLVLSCIILGMVFHYWNKWNKYQIEKRAIVEKERIESQLEVLKSQINPHFLFNSFNTLVAIIEDEPEEATIFVDKMSDFYRSILQYRNKDLIQLEDEIQILENYAFLLKQRFGDYLTVNLPVLKDTALFVPPLTLQILVENAIKHNIISKAKPLTIDIQLINESIVVKNNLQRKKTKEKSTNFGLQNIQTRYQLLGNKKVMIEETLENFIVSIPVFHNQNIIVS